MASKFGLAGGIPERRVRPIWDAIDSRQFKNALKLVTSLLSKNPNSPYAMVQSFFFSLFPYLLFSKSLQFYFFVFFVLIYILLKRKRYLLGGNLDVWVHLRYICLFLLNFNPRTRPMKQ